MNLSEAEQVVQTLKEQVADLQRSVFQSKAEKVADFEADKPRLKALLHALNTNRRELKAEVARLQAAVAKGAANQGPVSASGATTGFNAIKGRTGADGQPLSDEELEREASHVKDALIAIEARISQAQQELAGMRNRDEQEVWETNLVILQDTRRMQKEELALIEGELMGRQRLAKAAAERQAAEASGELALARASEKLLQAEARIDRIKQQLFFPACKGYTFALGSHGVYFGGKDIIVSEVSGSWAVKAEAGLVDKKGNKGARLTLQIGVPQAPPPARARNSLGSRPVSGSLKLGARAVGERQASFSLEPEPLEEEEAAPAAAPEHGSAVKPEDLGNSRGKRMAMKFVNKIANKEKYTQGLQGVRRGLNQAKSWASDKARQNGPSTPTGQQGASGTRSMISNRLGKARASAGRGLSAVGRMGRQLGHQRSDVDESLAKAGVSAYAGLGPTGTAQDDLAEAVADDLEDWQLESAPSEAIDTASTRSGGAGDTASSSASRQGMLVAIRCMEVAVVGEKGTKVPNMALQELSLEMDFQLSISWQYDPVTGWRASGRPVFEVGSLAREVRGNTLPLPRTLLKLVLSMVLPRVLQRKMQALLPPELGQYLAEAKRGVHVSGEISVVGPPLSALDADLAFQDTRSSTKPQEARRDAAHYAAAQEARSMLGLSPAQASVIAELFGGRLALLEPPRPCTLGALQAYHSVFSGESRAWEQLGAVWSAAARMASKVLGAGEAPDFLKLMNGTVAQLAKKPVRARLQVNRLEVAINFDAALDAVRDYFGRSAREAHARGAHLDLNASNPEASAPEGYQPLEVQLEALEAFHAWWLGKMRVFKSKFKEAGGTLVAAADAQSFSSGLENLRYEGPLKLEIPIPVEALESDGSLTFELPLPNPERQEGISRFVDGMRAAIATPVSMSTPAPKAIGKVVEQAGEALEQAGEALEQAGALWDGSPREWFATLQDTVQDKDLNKTWEDAAAAIGTLPDSLGKVIINGMRVRIKLDEQRLAELLQGMDASRIPGLLRHLGDVASLSFVPEVNAETGKAGYVIRVESSDAANLCAEAVGIGYRSGEGVSPGRLLRTAQALARAIMLTLRMDPVEIREVDEKMEEVYAVLIRDALDSATCLEGLATIEGGDLMLQIAGAPSEAGEPDAPPGHFTNDVDLAPLVSGLMATSIEVANDERIAEQLGFGRRPTA